MTRTDFGRSPEGSGYSAEPEPIFVVSAVPVSIPNAALLPGEIVQITNPEHHWFPCLAIVSENKAFGIQGFVFIPHNDDRGTGEAYIRLKFEDYEHVGAPALVLPTHTEDERASAIEARRAETAKTGSVADESADPSGETPRGQSQWTGLISGDEQPQQPSDMVERVARHIAKRRHEPNENAWRYYLRDAQYALEASHHAELVRTLQRCRRFFVSSWSAAEAEACLNELDTLLAKLGGGQ